METSGKIPEKSPFKVPENYFEEVNRKILAATSEKAVPKITVFRQLRPFLAAAAAVAILVTVGYFSTRLFSPAEKDNILPSLSLQENAEILLNEIDINTLENDSTLTGMLTENPDVSNSEIINYLIDENIDVNEIYERL